MIAITAGLRDRLCCAAITEPRPSSQRRPFISATREATSSYSRPTCRSRLSIRYARPATGQRPAAPLGTCISPYSLRPLAAPTCTLPLLPALSTPFQSPQLCGPRYRACNLPTVHKTPACSQRAFLLHFTAKPSSYKSFDLRSSIRCYQLILSLIIPNRQLSPTQTHPSSIL